jgi:hypothetical protein
VANGEMRGHVSLTLLEILELINFLKWFVRHSFGDQTLDVLIEWCKPVSSPLFIWSFDGGIIDVISWTVTGQELSWGFWFGFHRTYLWFLVR